MKSTKFSPEDILKLRLFAEVLRVFASMGDLLTYEFVLRNFVRWEGLAGIRANISLSNISLAKINKF